MPTFRGKPACDCLVQWLPVFEAELLRRGLIKTSIDVVKLVDSPGDDKSGNTHWPGGAGDIWQHGREVSLVGREMGAAMFERGPVSVDGFEPHSHFVLIGCPHNDGGRYQIGALQRGFNGLGRGGEGGRDTGPRPSKWRTWREGIEWAKARQAAYHWHQPGELGSADSGTALGVRKSFGALTHPSVIAGSAATSEGGGIRERSILRARVVTRPPRERLTFPVAAGHAPPPRAPKARAAFMRTFAKVDAGFKGGDLNVSGRIAARLTGRRVVGDGVLWLTVPRFGWTVLSTRAVDVGGDHHAVLVRVRHRKTGVVVRILVINAMSVSAGPAKAAEILAAGLDLKPHIVMASECADFRAVEVDADHHNKEKR